jgi:hypothetical protein
LRGATPAHTLSEPSRDPQEPDENRSIFTVSAKNAGS